MSYTRSYSEIVSGSQTITLSYPRSDSGGTVSGTATIDIPVHIQIHVDTRPFDNGVDSFKGHLDFLTGSIVTMEAAQVAMVKRNAKEISDRITSGFFGLIRSELTQQMAEYRSKAEALYLKLNDMKSACLQKTSQMGRDYARIADRYTDIFQNLDNEVKNRIGNLDSASFLVQREISQQASRVYDGTQSTVATIFSSENSQAQSTIVASGLRQRANQLLQNAHRFLLSDKRLSLSFKSMLSDSSDIKSKFYYLPAIYLLVDDPSGKGHEEVFTPNTKGSNLGTKPILLKLKEAFHKPEMEWATMSGQDRSQIETYLNRKIAELGNDANPHQARVCETLVRLWKNSRPQVIQPPC